MIDIQQRLQIIFETQRLVFWYDNDSALKEQFESIDLEAITKLVINNNEFIIKRLGVSLKDLSKKWFGFSRMDIESFEMMGKLN